MNQMKTFLMVSGSKRWAVVISEESSAKMYHEELTRTCYRLQYDQTYQCYNWKYHYDYAIWFANDHWCIGDDKDKGTEICSIKAAGSSEQLPPDLNGQWMYWNPDSKEWIRAGNDIRVKFAFELPYNQHSIE